MSHVKLKNKVNFFCWKYVTEKVFQSKSKEVHSFLKKNWILNNQLIKDECPIMQKIPQDYFSTKIKISIQMLLKTDKKILN